VAAAQEDLSRIVLGNTAYGSAVGQRLSSVRQASKNVRDEHWQRSLPEERVSAVDGIELIEQEVVIYEVSDDEVEVAAMKERAGAWTFVCTMGCDVIEPGPSVADAAV